jgi:hypothetical protein
VPLETEFTISNELLNPANESCAAVTRCYEAWNRTFKSEKMRREPYGPELRDARNAYCKAMPPLAGYHNIRDFIACVAQGIMLGAISESQSTRLLYAVQVAQTALRYHTSRKPSI